MRFPDFICVGIQKSGTTWLYNLLHQTDFCKTTPVKELHYFDEIDRKKGTTLFHRFFGKHYLNQHWRSAMRYWLKRSLKERNLKMFLWVIVYFFAPRTFALNLLFYRILFSASNDFLIGDITPDYAFLSESAIQKITQAMPGIKIILLLREPVERNWSSAKMILAKARNRRVGELTMAELEAFTGHEDTLMHSDYRRIIETWEKYLPPGHLKVAFFDDLAANPTALAEEIFEFVSAKPVNRQLLKSVPKTSNTGLEGNIPDDFAKLMYPVVKQQYLYLLQKYPGNKHVIQWHKEAERRWA